MMLVAVMIGFLLMGCASAKKKGARLYDAVEEHDVALVRQLIQNGADVNWKDSNGRTALHEAAYDGNLDIAVLLIEAGAEVDVQDDWGRTPLHVAAGGGSQDICTVLLQHGADINAQDNIGETPLHEAAEYGRQEACTVLLQHGADINAQDDDGKTPLHAAAGGGSQEVCTVLLQHGADINAQDNAGMTPLHDAARFGHQETCTVLLQHGADVNAQDNDGETPLHDAARGGSQEVCTVLLQHGADINAQDYYGETPLHEAAKRGHQEVCTVLLQHGADVNAQENDGETPLHEAAWWGSQEACTVLLQHGADVKAQDNTGYTALMYAIQKERDTPLIKLLLQWGSNTTIEYSDENTVLDLAHEQPDKQTILQELYCDPFTLPVNGRAAVLTTTPGKSISITCPYGDSIETYSLFCQLNRTWDGRPLCNTDGCISGTYGDNCTMCGHCGNNDMCDKVIGMCPSGCSAGYWGFRCDQGCVDGKYGANCMSICGHCGNTATCNRIGGECPDDCETGYYGLTCNHECHCATGDKCNGQTGKCPSGCAAGYHTDKCDQVCVDGTYGKNCLFRCGHCNNATCNRIGGGCPDDCEAGYYGLKCNQQCHNCASPDICDSKKGKCPRGCAAGYRGTKCNRGCLDGTYGANCVSICGHCNNSTCNRIGGECPDDCETGYYGLTCDHECHCATGDKCNGQTGKCPSGCSAGYHTDKCDQVCVDGRYGTNCLFKCGRCNNATCDRIGGGCPDDCEAGYYGLKCNQTCGHCALGDKCNQIRGFCPGKCEDGYYSSPNCDQKCGYCQFEAICDSQTGKCPSGCTFGYHGDNCKKDTYKWVLIISAALITLIGLVVGCAFIVRKIVRTLKQDAHQQQNEPIEMQQIPLVETTEEEESTFLLLLKKMKLELYESVINHQLDNQRVEVGRNVLGEGHFGVVYKGTYNSAEGQKPIAAKTLKGNPSSRAYSEFIEEATMMMEFQHENVLTIYGVMIKEDKPFVILPFMENGDLHSYLVQPSNKISLAEMLQYGVQIARGMNYLAQMKFIHRDLAARNCMISQNQLVKIADFGLARDIYEKQYYRIDDLKRPLPYKWLALETLQTQIFSPKSDVWSFGVTLWEILMRGVTPYPDIDPIHLRRYLEGGHRMDQPPFCPSSIYAIMISSWLTNPEERNSFKTIEENLIKALPNSITSKGSSAVMNIGINERDDYLEPVHTLPSELGAMTVEIHTAKDENLEPLNIPSAWHDKHDVTVIDSESELSDVLCHESTCADIDNIEALTIQSLSQVTTNPTIPLLVAVPVVLEQSEEVTMATGSIVL